MSQKSWIDQLLKVTDDAETPRSFIYWAGIAAISAIAAPNVYLNRQGKYKLRPNIYCLLIAKSGLGKGLPTFIAKELVARLKVTRLISGRATIQKIVKDLGTTVTEPDKEGPKWKDARGFIVSGEFATSMQRDLDAFTILTDLYDTHYQAVWENTTKMSGSEKLFNPCITLFSGASPEHFEDFIPKVNLFGGFIGRTLLVYEEKRHTLNPLLDEDAPDLPWNELLEHLKLVAKVQGKFRWTAKGKDAFKDWYADFRPREYDDKTGTTERMPDHVLKVAMCISLARDTELSLTEEDINEAIERCLSLSFTTKRLSIGGGKSSAASQTKAALDIILNSHDFTITRQEWLVKGFQDFDSIELDRIVQTLEQAEFIRQIGKTSLIYQVTERGRNLWLAKKKEVEGE